MPASATIWRTRPRSPRISSLSRPPKEWLPEFWAASPARLVPLQSYAVTDVARHVCRLRQGVSRAGEQTGLDHAQTGLIREVFRIIDESGALHDCTVVRSTVSMFPRASATATCNERFFAFLENVGNLLSPKLRPLLLFVLEDSTRSGCQY